MCIVIAWKISIKVPIDYENTRVDLGERPTLKDEFVPRAAVWLSNGTPDDLAEAEVFAKKLESPARSLCTLSARTTRSPRLRKPSWRRDVQCW